MRYCGVELNYFCYILIIEYYMVDGFIYLFIYFFCRMLTSFLVGLFNLYEDLYFTYLEINPLGKPQKQPTPPQLSARFLIQFFPMFWHC